MTIGNSAFELREGTGWTRGLSNLLSAELGRWFGTKKWWVQILIWAGLVNLILFAVAMSEDGGDGPGLLFLFNTFLGVFGTFGVCILMQGSIVGEKQTGTAAWVLSNPVTRPAFVLAKLIANMFGIAVTMLLAQGLIAYLIIYFDSGTALPPLAFLGGLGVHLIHYLFYASFSLMLGAFFAKRGPVIAVPLVFLFVQQLLAGIFPVLIKFLPYTLAIPLDETVYPSVAVAVMTGMQPASYLPLATTLVASVLLVTGAIWLFQRQDF